jgi:putative ATPase
MGAARQTVQDSPGAEVPVHLRQAGYQGAALLGHGEGYRYPHDHPGHIVRQQYLPDGITEAVFFHPSAEGREAEFAERLKIIDEELGKSRRH